MSPKRIPFTIPATPPAVLVADADADTRALYRYAFEADGYRVVEACDGCEALSKALAERPAVIVTETTLAYVDGYALCEILRRDPLTNGIPIVVVAAKAGSIHDQRARKAGATAVLVKPLDTAVIVTELQRVLDDSSADRPANTAELGRTHVAHRSRAGRHLSKSFARATTITPQAAAIALRCPGCDRPLTYERSHFGGVNASHAEQWDDYSCERCGPFKFRHRTRKLTRIAP
jgi:CheY-like chemotaxis protein